MGKRKIILEPIHMENRVADSCFSFGKERAYILFTQMADVLYDMLVNGLDNQTIDSDVQVCLDTYMQEAKRQKPFTDILGQAINQLVPYMPGHIERKPYIPLWLTSIMVGTKYVESCSIRSITDKNCGSGTFILMLMDTLLKKDDCNIWKFHASDSDLLNTKLCAIQFIINAALHGHAPAQLTICHEPLGGQEQRILQMAYYESSKQYEIYRPGLSVAGSAQALLFG